jgi:predicted porin
VTVYGIVDFGYNSLEQTTSAGAKGDTVTSLKASEASSSRLGFRGTEDLGGGLKATFVAESGITDNTALTFGGRGFWIGLEDAKMGQVRVGRQNSFARDVWLGADQLAAANVVGNLAHSTVLASNVSTAAHTDFNTAVNYMSPSLNGFTIMAGMMENTTESATGTKTKTGSGSQIGLRYAAGNLTVAVSASEATTTSAAIAAVTARPAVAESDTVVGRAAITAVTAVPATDVKTKDTAGAITYKLGAANLAYIYMDRDIQNGAQREAHSFSASYPLTAKLVGRVGYGFGDYAASSTATKYDMKGMQAALNYNLSKRSTVYAIYGDEKRDTSATQQLKAKEYSVGVRHSF